MSELVAKRAFDGLAPVGEGAGVRVRLRDLAIVSVLARKGATEALVQKASSDFSLSLIDEARRSEAGGMSALGIGPGRWLFVREHGERKLMDDLGASFSGLAALSDHSDGYALFEIAGADVRRALAKGVPIDLAEGQFGENDVAVTIIAHIGAVLWRGRNGFCIAVFRSYAGSFWHWLSASAAEFGLAIEEAS